MLAVMAWRWLKRARKAARARRWSVAIGAYESYLARVPGRAAVWVQLGHARKEVHDLVGAVAAYEEASARAPDLADAWLHLGHARRSMGDRDGARTALGQVLIEAPDSQDAIDALLAMGARDQLPLDIQRRLEAGPAAGGERSFALSRYHQARLARDMTPPADWPANAPEPALAILVSIDAQHASSSAIEDSVASLLEQSDGSWRAIIWCAASMPDHPAMRRAAIDPRIRLVTTEADVGTERHDGMMDVLMMDAGLRLDRHAIAWFQWAKLRTGAALVYCDHDEASIDANHVLRFERPVFQPMYDPRWFDDEAPPPPLLLVAPAQFGGADRPWRLGRRKMLQSAASQAVAHIPLPLATLPLATLPLAPLPLAPLPATTRPSADGSGVPGMVPAVAIQVVVQTRDQAELLDACVRSLRARAAMPDALDIVIVDNRSERPETARLLERWTSESIVRVLPLDETFNWARANNLAAADGDAPLILFLNNDTEMLSDGWDDLLRGHLADQRIGAVGAQLFYPDGTIQHAGIILGMNRGHPIHEGVGQPREQGGAQSRWHRSRLSAAVTGAWLAMRRDTFEATGGFNPLLAIAFNDVDMCLKVRARGQHILMSPTIQATHYESITRGLNLSEEALARDRAEFAILQDAWGEGLDEDPAYNPNWVRHGYPFDGTRLPTQQEVLAWLIRSAAADPWRLPPASPYEAS